MFKFFLFRIIMMLTMLDFWLSGQLQLNLHLHLQLQFHLQLHQPEQDMSAVVNILQLLAFNVHMMETLGFQKVGAMGTVTG